MAIRPKNILIISNDKEQRETLKTLLEDNNLKDIEFKTHSITFKECMSHRLNEPMLDLIIIGYDVADHTLSYLLRAIKEKRIITIFSKEPTPQQSIVLRNHDVVATFTEPMDIDEFIWKVVEIVDKHLYNKLIGNLDIKPFSRPSREKSSLHTNKS